MSCMAEPSLQGKFALVVGGGGGIGRSISQLLEREGARVAVADINMVAAQETVSMLRNPESHLAVHMDITKKEAVTKGVAAATEAFGEPPSLLANSVGIASFIRLEDQDEEDFDEVIDVNLKGSFLVAQAVAKALKVAGIKSGSFVLISSITAYMADASLGHYAASKNGIIALTKTFAKELAEDGIRVNVVLPGIIDTPVTSGELRKTLHAKYVPSTPLNRVGRPEEVSEVVIFLLSDRSSYVTGAEFRVTGGLAM